MKNGRLHLLIVEDEAAHVEAIRRAFDQAGVKADIQSAGTLREYRDIIAAHPPDFVLVDLNLPDGRATDILTHPAAEAPAFRTDAGGIARRGMVVEKPD